MDDVDTEVNNDVKATNPTQPTRKQILIQIKYTYLGIPNYLGTYLGKLLNYRGTSLLIIKLNLPGMSFHCLVSPCALFKLKISGFGNPIKMIKI